MEWTLPLLPPLLHRSPQELFHHALSLCPQEHYLRRPFVPTQCAQQWILPRLNRFDARAVGWCIAIVRVSCQTGLPTALSAKQLVPIKAPSGSTVRQDLRQDEDLDFVFAEKDADAGDDCMADPADVDPDPLVATMLDSDEEDTGTVDTVLAEACAKLELDIIRAMETMLLESKLPKKQLDEVCQRVIYSTTHRIQLGKTKIVPPNRQGRPAAFAGRGGSGPRPIPTSAKSDAFRAAVKIGRPKTTGAADAPRRFPLPPLDDIQKRLGSQARSPPKVVLGPSTTGTALMDGVTSSRSTSVVTVHVPLAVSVSTPRASTAPKRRQPAMTKGEAGVSLQDSPIKKKPAASAAMAADSAV